MALNRRSSWRQVLYDLIMIVFCIAMLYPVLWMIFSSFKPSDEVMSSQGRLWPSQWFPQNYPNGWRGISQTSFGTFFKNSLIYAGLGTIFQVFSSAFVAYGFARLRFRLRAFWFACMIITMMLPFQVLMIPQFVLFHKLGWTNSFLPLLVPTLGGGAFFIFLIMQFISGIPRDLDEAAVIDGASRYGIFFRIILPLIKSSMVTAAIFSFYWKWDDYLAPMLYLSKPSTYTVSIALKLFSDPDALTSWGEMFAMSTLSLLPIFIIFLSLQRYLVEGISTSGLKA